MTAATAPTREIGYSAEAVKSSNWWMYDGETTPELQFPQSIQVYDQMRKSDAQVKSVLQAVMLPVRRTPWRIDPNGARTEVVEWVANDLGLPIVGQNPKPPLRTRDRFSWDQHLFEALSMLPFGFSYFEQTYTIVEGGDRAHLHKLGLRPARTIFDIDVARDGGLVSITQNGILDQGGAQKPIPVSRLVAYVHEREGGNWLGRSILRPAYKNFLIKERLQRVEAQTIERNGMGIPTYTAAEGEQDLAKGLGLATSLRAGEAAGAAIPNTATLKLMGVEGDLPDAQPAIRYHDEQIARAVLAHFLNLGTQTGSWALGTTFADFFTLSLQTFAQQIAVTATQHVVEDLVDVNWGPEEPAPRICFDEIGSRQAATAQAIKSLVDAGIIEPDEVLEQSTRQQYGLPPKDPDTVREADDDGMGGGGFGGSESDEFGAGSVAGEGGPKGLAAGAAAGTPTMTRWRLRSTPTGRVEAKFNPAQPRVPGGEHGGEWTLMGLVKDLLKLADRIDLESGEELVGSNKVKGDDGTVRLALTSRRGVKSVRLGIGGPDFGGRDDEAGPWRGGPAREDANRAKLRDERFDLEELGEDAWTPEQEARFDELDSMDLGDVDPIGYTSRLDSESTERLRATLADALVRGTQLDTEVNGLFDRQEALDAVVDRKWTPAEEAEWDAIKARLAVLAPDKDYTILAEGSIPGEWADVRYEVYFDDPSSGVVTALDAVPHGQAPGYFEARFDAAELRALLRLLARTGVVQARAKFNPALHPRDREGQFRTTFDRIIAGLRGWAAAGGEGDPFEGFDRVQLHRVATKQRGLTFKRGASREEIGDALLADLRAELGGGERDDAKVPATHRDLADAERRALADKRSDGHRFIRSRDTAQGRVYDLYEYRDGKAKLVRRGRTEAESREWNGTAEEERQRVLDAVRNPPTPAKKAAPAKKAPAFDAAEVAGRVASQKTEADVIKVLSADPSLTSAKLRKVAEYLGIDIPENVRAKSALQLFIAEHEAGERDLPGGFATPTTPAKKATPARKATPRKAPGTRATKIKEAVSLVGDPEGDNSIMHGDSATMELAQAYARKNRNGTANRLMELRRSTSTMRGEDAKDLDGPQKLVDELKRLREAETDEQLARKLDDAIKELDFPKTPVPSIPDGTPPAARKLLEDLNKIPVARAPKGSRLHGHTTLEDSPVDRLAAVFQEIEEKKGQVSGGEIEREIEDILRTYHESIDGAYRMWGLSTRTETDNDLRRQLNNWIKQLRAGDGSGSEVSPATPAPAKTPPAPDLTGLTIRQKRARLKALGFTPEQIDDLAPTAAGKKVAAPKVATDGTVLTPRAREAVSWKTDGDEEDAYDAVAALGKADWLSIPESDRALLRERVASYESHRGGGVLGPSLRRWDETTPTKAALAKRAAKVPPLADEVEERARQRQVRMLLQDPEARDVNWLLGKAQDFDDDSVKFAGIGDEKNAATYAAIAADLREVAGRRPPQATESPSDVVGRMRDEMFPDTPENASVRQLLTLTQDRVSEGRASRVSPERAAAELRNGGSEYDDVTRRKLIEIANALTLSATFPGNKAKPLNQRQTDAIESARRRSGNPYFRLAALEKLTDSDFKTFSDREREQVQEAIDRLHERASSQGNEPDVLNRATALRKRFGTARAAPKAVRAAGHDDTGEFRDDELDDLEDDDLEDDEEDVVDEPEVMAPATRDRALAFATRAMGHDVPGHDEFEAYWTRGEGLARWLGRPHEWTTLRNLLRKHRGIRDPEGLATKYFHKVKGFYPGADLHRVEHGKPPRGHRVGPG